MKPLVQNQSVIVNAHHVYSRRCNIFDIFVEQLMLAAMYLANPRDISQTVDHRRCQHAKKQCASGFTLPNGRWYLQKNPNLTVRDAMKLANFSLG